MQVEKNVKKCYYKIAECCQKSPVWQKFSHNKIQVIF